METSAVACDDSDSEVFEANCSAPSLLNRVSESSHEQASTDTRINSSSSSSCDDKVPRSPHESPHTPIDVSSGGHTVSGQTVEWRPTTKCAENNIGHGGSGSGGGRKRREVRKTPSDDLQSPSDDLHEALPHRGTLTVMIDPPNDEEQLFAESAGDTESNSRFTFRRPSNGEEEIFADLDDSDSECEESEGTALTKTCLLSR